MASKVYKDGYRILRGSKKDEKRVPSIPKRVGEKAAVSLERD